MAELGVGAVHADLAPPCDQVTQLTKMLDAFLEGEIEDPDLLECYFLEALYCSLGACLLDFGRIRFDECIKRLASLPSAELDGVWAHPGELPGGSPVARLPVSLPPPHPAAATRTRLPALAALLEAPQVSAQGRAPLAPGACVCSGVGVGGWLPGPVVRVGRERGAWEVLQEAAAGNRGCVHCQLVPRPMVRFHVSDPRGVGCRFL